MQVAAAVCGGPRRGHGFQIAGGHHDEHDPAAVPARRDDACPTRGRVVPGPLHRHTHNLYADQLRRWFAWCRANDLDALIGIQRAHLKLYIRHLGESGLQVSSVNTMMHGVRGFFPVRPHGRPDHL